MKYIGLTRPSYPLCATLKRVCFYFCKCSTRKDNKETAKNENDEVKMLIFVFPIVYLINSQLRAETLDVDS
jgi:hypothetical protein